MLLYFKNMCLAKDVPLKSLKSLQAICETDHVALVCTRWDEVVFPEEGKESKKRSLGLIQELQAGCKHFEIDPRNLVDAERVLGAVLGMDATKSLVMDGVGQTAALIPCTPILDAEKDAVIM